MEVVVELLEVDQDGSEVFFKPDKVLVVGRDEPLTLLHHFGELGFKSFDVLPHFLVGVLEWCHPVLAVEVVVVHAAGTEGLPTYRAVNREDDVVLQAALDFPILHQGLSDFNWLLHFLSSVRF